MSPCQHLGVSVPEPLESSITTAHFTISTYLFSGERRASPQASPPHQRPDQRRHQPPRAAAWRTVRRDLLSPILPPRDPTTPRRPPLFAAIPTSGEHRASPARSGLVVPQRPRHRCICAPSDNAAWSSSPADPPSLPACARSVVPHLRARRAKSPSPLFLSTLRAGRNSSGELYVFTFSFLSFSLPF